jgi:hypothetical protein
MEFLLGFVAIAAQIEVAKSRFQVKTRALGNAKTQQLAFLKLPSRARSLGPA